eukprot:1161757-Pelagomonas_calceolata.AAC.11
MNSCMTEGGLWSPRCWVVKQDGRPGGQASAKLQLFMHDAGRAVEQDVGVAGQGDARNVFLLSFSAHEQSAWSYGMRVSVVDGALKQLAPFTWHNQATNIKQPQTVNGSADTLRHLWGFHLCYNWVSPAGLSKPSHAPIINGSVCTPLASASVSLALYVYGRLEHTIRRYSPGTGRGWEEEGYLGSPDMRCLQ